jgi:hypothetical protein
MKGALTIFVIFLGLLLYGGTREVYGQTIISAESISVELSPKFPGPSSEVRAKLVSFTFDEDRATIEWILDGKRISEGVGAKEVSFSVGPLGSISTLRVLASPQEGGRIEKTLEIRPSSIDMLVQSQSYIPPWYKGAPVVTPKGQVRVVAIPHFIFQGGRLDPKTLIYNWKLDGVVRGDLSGRGRQSLNFRSPLTSGQRTKISVAISSPQETFESVAEVIVETQKPEIQFYERRPLEGLISSQALSSKTIKGGSELEVEAVPFFMNFTSLQELNFNWSLEGNIALEPYSGGRPNIFLVKPIQGSSGNALIKLVINNLKNVLEQISASFSINVE